MRKYLLPAYLSLLAACSPVEQTTLDNLEQTNSSLQQELSSAKREYLQLTQRVLANATDSIQAGRINCFEGGNAYIGWRQLTTAKKMLENLDFSAAKDIARDLSWHIHKCKAKKEEIKT